jgi:hypothetical protein
MSQCELYPRPVVADPAVRKSAQHGCGVVESRAHYACKMLQMPPALRHHETIGRGGSCNGDVEVSAAGELHGILLIRPD